MKLNCHESPCRNSPYPNALRWLVAVILILGMTLQAAARTAPTVLMGSIVKVTDGDTVTLLDEQSAKHKIRLAGIDAPESKMPYGQRATRLLSSLILGKDVTALTYKNDRYGRAIATLMIGKRDINLAMVEAGLPWHYKQYAKEQPPAEAVAYAQAEDLARMKRLELWQDSNPTAPWDWRRAHQRRSDKGCGAIILSEQATRAGAVP